MRVPRLPTVASRPSRGALCRMKGVLHYSTRCMRVLTGFGETKPVHARQGVLKENSLPAVCVLPIISASTCAGRPCAPLLCRIFARSADLALLADSCPLCNGHVLPPGNIPDKKCSLSIFCILWSHAICMRQ